MTAFLLKLSEGIESFYTVAGLKSDSLIIQDGSMSISGRGIFTGVRAESVVMGLAARGTEEPMQLSFEDGRRIRGNFRVTRFERLGDFNGERQYRVSLSSDSVNVEEVS